MYKLHVYRLIYQLQSKIEIKYPKAKLMKFKFILI